MMKGNNDELDYKQVHKWLMKKDRLTKDLCQEIIKHWLRAEYVNEKTGKQDEEAFEGTCSVIFPVGRVFASSLQLQQMP